MPSLRRSVTSTLSLGFGLSGSLPPAQLNKCMALPFFDIPDHVLLGYMDAGEPNKVIDYIKAAKRAGKEDVVRRGCVLFAFGLKDRIEKFVARKFPSEDRDEVAAGAILEITRTILEKTPPDDPDALMKWIFTIADRYRAGLYRTNKYRFEREAVANSLDQQLDGGTDRYDLIPGQEDFAFDLVDSVDVFVRALDKIANLKHRLVIYLHVYYDLDAIATCEVLESEYGIHCTPQNVNKIKERYEPIMDQMRNS